MTSYINSISQTIASYLPQNEETSKAASLQQRIDTLQGALLNTQGPIFKDVFQETIEGVQAEKNQHLQTIRQLNGAFFEDPSSLLKQARDTLVTTVLDALNIYVGKDTNLDDITIQLEASDSSSENVQKAIQALSNYVRLEKERDDCMTQLSDIINMEMTPSLEEMLVKQKQTLEKRQYVLMGAYQKDPSALLHQAWEAYKSAESLDPRSQDTDKLCRSFYVLEEERRSNDAQLHTINDQLFNKRPSGRTYEQMTVEEINRRVSHLQELHRDAASKAGVDWMTTALIAVPVAIVSAVIARRCLATTKL